MKVVRAAALLLLSLPPCAAQEVRDPVRAADEAYTSGLVRLVTGLQKNPWQGWKAGTVVVVRHLGDPSANPSAHVQPDLVYRVAEADKLFIRTQVFKGRSVRQKFLVKDQQGLDASSVRAKDAAAAEVELDGFVLPGLLSTSSLEEFPGGTWIRREWSLAGHPSVLLRQEVNGVGWRVTSAKVSKRIGGREFPCVEIKRRLTIYYGGRSDVLTTQYLSPEVPGHLVEEIQEFYRGAGEQRSPAPYLVVHQRVVEVKSS